jgi:hypothetical protein
MIEECRTLSSSSVSWQERIKMSQFDLVKVVSMEYEKLPVVSSYSHCSS